jgi:protein-S-isoprenylcysteine O-methyltransferase Ste14
MNDDRQTAAAPSGEPSFKDIMLAVRNPAVLFNVPVHLFILIPITCFIAYLSTRIDQHMGWGRFIPFSAGLALFAILFPLGIYVVWYTYGYLSIKGDGSPATHLGGTKILVTTGPFAICRHPSIIGKFMGVVALGFLVGSPAFFFLVIPALTTYSLVAARYLQERLCVQLWGDEYIHYRHTTPLILPRLSGRKSTAS